MDWKLPARTRGRIMRDDRADAGHPCLCDALRKGACVGGRGPEVAAAPRGGLQRRDRVSGFSHTSQLVSMTPAAVHWWLQ